MRYFLLVHDIAKYSPEILKKVKIIINSKYLIKIVCDKTVFKIITINKLALLVKTLR